MIFPPNLNNKIGKTLEKKMTGNNICKYLNEKIYETDEREMLYEIHKNNLLTYLCMAMMAVWSESKLMNP